MEGLASAGLSDEQLEARLTGIGASEIAAVCGKNPWQAPIDVWRAKVSGATVATNMHMERGNLLEHYCIEVYRSERGPCRDLGHMTRRHDQHGWMLATLDAAVMDGLDMTHVVECKAPRERMDSIPTHYRYQMQQQMMVSGARSGSLVAIYGDWHPDFLRALFDRDEGCDAFLEGILAAGQFQIFDMDWDEELAEEIIEKGAAFWNDYVQTKTPPPPDGSESYSDFMGDAPESDGIIVEANEELEELCIAYVRAKADADESGKEEQRLRQCIEQLAGHHDGCTFAFGRQLTWKLTKGRTSASPTQLATLARALGATDAQIKSCSNTGSPYRVFRLKEAK